jgi:hybrid cluster-associated redox disulfide protein
MNKKTKKTTPSSKKAKIQKPKINKKMTFIQVMQKEPEAANFLMEQGLHCVGCGMAAYETVEQGAIMHGINPDKLVDEINKKFGSKKSKKK